MKRSLKFLAGVLLAGAAIGALQAPAYAAGKTTAQQIDELQKQIQALSAQVEDLKKQSQDNEALQAQVQDLKRQNAQNYADVQAQRAADSKVTVNNGRPAWTSGDGRFSASLRSLLQFDAGYYAQGRRANVTAGPVADFDSGTNFRRARIGVEGTLFKTWSYSFLYDLGGSAIQSSSLSDAYVQYNGFAPFAVRFGAFATPAGLEDQTGTGDLIFTERAAPTDLYRNLVGADGRQNYIGLFGSGDDWYGAVSVSGARSNDSTLYSDEQVAIVSRGAYRIYSDAEDGVNVVLSGTGSYVAKTPDAAASPAGASNLNLQIGPEASVDDNNNRLVSTGNINASHLTQWGIEAGAQWQSLYAQGGYFEYEVDRRASTLESPTFNGWYAQATWILTGERRRYQTASATWAAPQPANAFDFSGDHWGAWEVAARYSDLDLNYKAGVVGSAAPSTSSIRGGEQKIWTLGVNWYPNNNIRFLLDYQNVDVNRIGTLTTTSPSATISNAQIGQKLDIITLRTQLAF